MGKCLLQWMSISLMFARQKKIDYAMELYMKLFLQLYLFRIVRLSGSVDGMSRWRVFFRSVLPLGQLAVQ